ncbi:hypothetical protein G6F57_017230 [Rhizopus arrhizus]|nr:hypothetical protein G6F57_017230 [Rhizopus arrhizus]
MRGCFSFNCRNIRFRWRFIPNAAGICRRWGGVAVQDRWRHGWRHRAPMDGFTACPGQGVPAPPSDINRGASASTRQRISFRRQLVHPYPVGEQRERQHAGQPIRPAHPVRQPARWLQHPTLEQRRKRNRIGQAHLASEQPAADLQPVFGQHMAEEGVHRHQATQVHRVLGEGQATAGRYAAEHALRRGETFFGVLPGIAEIAEHLDEIGAFARHRNRFGTQADAFQALDVDAAGDLFGERRQPFLGRGHPRRRQRQARQHRLCAAIQRGQRMHQCFMVEQLRAVPPWRPAPDPAAPG